MARTAAAPILRAASGLTRHFEEIGGSQCRPLCRARFGEIWITWTRCGIINLKRGTTAPRLSVRPTSPISGAPK